MLCIEVSRNGKRLATAGLPRKGVLSVIFDRVLSDAHGPAERRHFSLGGLDTSTEPNSSLHWVAGDVQVGDEFVVRYLERISADPPKRSEPSTRPSAAELRRFRQQQLRNLGAEIKRVRKLIAHEKKGRGAQRNRRKKAVSRRKRRS